MHTRFAMLPLLFAAETVCFMHVARPLAARRETLSSMVTRRAGALSVRAVAASPDLTTSTNVDLNLDRVHFSGLGGKALLCEKYPTRKEVIQTIPEQCFKKDTLKSLSYAATSTLLTLGCVAIGSLIPFNTMFLPVWALYAVVTGTVATGCWVIAHECGHGAFSDNKLIETSVGYLLHTALLVPYFSWQRSHAVHHAHTNHMELGETHVPPHAQSGLDSLAQRKALVDSLGETAGNAVFGAKELFTHLVFGWPAYLLTGATGGPARGLTNHFWPLPPFATGNKNTELFPGAWKAKVFQSDIGIAAMVGLLSVWAAKMGFWHMAALYLGPLAITNVWLVLYTWLQHTDVDVPHFGGDNFDFIKGAFMSIDRPYGPLLDFLHHRIGSTHVAHHIDCTIPHYRAVEATQAIKAAFPQCYLYEPSSIWQAMWRVATQCVAVERRGDKYVFVAEPAPASSSSSTPVVI